MLRPLLFVLLLLLAHAAFGQGLQLMEVKGGVADGGLGSARDYCWGPRGYGADVHALGDSGATCEGWITFVYQWNKAYGPPPMQAVVDIQSDASLEAFPDETDGADCADGLDDPMWVGGHPGEYLAESSGERYRVMKLDGDTLTVILKPHSYSSYIASVWVQVNPAPITVKLTGPRIAESGGYECMVGRGVTGSLDAGGYAIEPATYRWSIGGSRYFSYIADDYRGTLYDLSDRDQTSPYPSWFWNVEGEPAVQCSLRSIFQMELNRLLKQRRHAPS